MHCWLRNFGVGKAPICGQRTFNSGLQQRLAVEGELALCLHQFSDRIVQAWLQRFERFNDSLLFWHGWQTDRKPKKNLLIQVRHRRTHRLLAQKVHRLLRGEQALEELGLQGRAAPDDHGASTTQPAVFTQGDHRTTAHFATATDDHVPALKPKVGQAIRSLFRHGMFSRRLNTPLAYVHRIDDGRSALHIVRLVEAAAEGACLQCDQLAQRGQRPTRGQAQATNSSFISAITPSKFSPNRPQAFCSPPRFANSA